MKQFILAISLLLTISATSQECLSNLPQNKAPNELTFYDYQNALNTYWNAYKVERNYYLDNKGVKQKVPGWKLFKRGEFYWESRMNQSTSKFPKTSATDEYYHWLSNNHESNTKSTSGNWRSLEPSRSGGGYAGTGRLNCIAFHRTCNILIG